LHIFFQPHRNPIAKLRPRRPVYDFAGDCFPETIVTLETANGLIAHLAKSGSESNMNLLLSFASRAMHGHHNNVFVGHC
jgi:hypothetical protein